MGSDPTWYKDAIIYELHVRAFCDTNGDGIGDFRGLAERLEYLQDLGVTAIWLLPFYPSPLRDDGYDIADYTRVHEDYGTVAEFKTFLREAHRRGLKVITELVINHTSDEHAWFKAARRAAPNSSKRDYYVWSDTPDKFRDARIIFKDFESSNWAWDPAAKAYYWHRFYSHQPDLNFDNPAVRKAVFRVMDFWLRMGVDGLRLDAIPYLFERDGTSCENLEETHQFLKTLREYVDSRYEDRMLLAEANQWPDDAIAYFGDGDESHMNFHFPLMPRMFMALSMEDRFPIIDIFEQTPDIPDPCQWAIFLRNHDELTLEMVTDEERDYMYRAYAHEQQMRINFGIRRRLAPLMGNDRRKIELMNGLLFSMPGTPVLYYGDEIGMGDNVFLGDRNGVRTPLQWSPDRNAGFSKANPQRVYLPVIIDPEYHYESVNIETQRNNPQSLFWWMKRLIATRKRYRAFGRGTMEFLHPENPQILAYLRRYEDECILVVANLSRFSQFAELDLSEFEGICPVEVFGRTRFPQVTDRPYPITMGPHSFLWFALEPERVGEGTAPAGREEIPQLSVTGTWDKCLRGPGRPVLEQVLPGYVANRRWFGAQTRNIREAKISEFIPLGSEPVSHYLTLVQVFFMDGGDETYVVPIGFASGEKAEEVREHHRSSVLARLSASGRSNPQEGLVYDAIVDPAFAEEALSALARRRSFRGRFGHLVASPHRGSRKLIPSEKVDTSVLGAEQSNSSIMYGDRLIMKLFRCVKEGVNPDLEISRVLTKRRDFDVIPPLAGALEYRSNDQEPRTIAVFQGFVRNEGDAWQYTLRQLGGFFEQAMAQHDGQEIRASVPHAPLSLIDKEPPPEAESLIGHFLDSASFLGQRTAELHIGMASASDDPNFVPESFTPFYQRSLFQMMRNQSTQTFRLLRRRLNQLPEVSRPEAQWVLDHEADVFERFEAIRRRKITAMRIRCHGDYHLGQVLHTGKDFVIIDFEGEPARPISERRIKRPALQDVAGMLRSFHYASQTVYLEATRSAVLHEEDTEKAVQSLRFWYEWVSAAFLKSYLDVAGDAAFLPKTKDELRVLLEAHLLEKALYEVRYELNNRPNWICVPLRGIHELLSAEEAS